MMLWASAMTQNFAAPIWMTFKQAKELNANVRKGSKGTLVVYADRLTKTEVNKDGQENERDIYFMKGYTVFNVEQIEGLPPHFYAVAAPQLDPVQRIDAADLFFANTGADIRHGGNQAYYAATPDYVQMPPFVSFKDAESYYATLAHEMTHWTRHPARLDRDFGRKKFGDEGYAREELVAEIGAAFLCCDLGITPEPRDDHAAYLGHWLKVLKEDKRAIFQAAAHAQRAVDFQHGLQHGEAAEARQRGNHGRSSPRLRTHGGHASMTPLEITEDEFDTRYPLVINHLNPNASWAFGDGPGCLFETYGQELAFVRSQDPRTIWTLVDGDDGNQYLLSGFHFVNRIGYLVSTVPFPEDADILVPIPTDSDAQS